jgi:D-inositol-3-phosphate glycosyltransferase
MHTMAKVKNLSLAQGDSPEPSMRVMGEQQVVDSSDRIIANTTTEAQELIRLYGADLHQTAVVHPGVDLGVFSPGDSTVARARAGLPQDARVLLFVGRIQPLKAPDVIIRLTADLVERDPTLRHSLLSVICGGPSGAGPERLDQLHKLAADLGVSDVVRFLPPANRADLADLYRAADVVLVPSHSESFGLVAIEAQACGTPVVAADVGGLATAVRHNNSGLLVGDHEPSSWHDAVAGLLADDHHLERLARGARPHAQDFSWTATAAATLAVYREAISQREEGLHGGTNQTIGSIA